ncbi:family 20 glycosylhydrolase [Pedobacter cryophilus]|uniref:beta-N-acetylhexosaminidase n=1 Tax=Pedobacter cryophilus TaxID=2571271 RepID=A0A4U1BZJ8_9SPHI|nr:family 20 glycosylhydrolase [Pedobacter cryophilus]TKB96007.1 beta-N-acetylhexosaminidase [Pedobacter cryophilus]
MRSLIFIFIILNAISVSAQSTDINLGIIPAPKSISLQSGYFVLSSQTALQYETEADKKIAEFFKDLVKEKEGFDLVVAKNFIQAPQSVISFNSAGSTNSSEEAYTLKVNSNNIQLLGKEKGVFYAMQTLSQLYLNNLENHQIPQCEIIDEPRYAYRGLHLDVGRHFFSIDFIKKYIDFMAVYKLNNFHWHLTEDQGWRIEIKKYPKLTEIGAYRAQTVVGNYHDRMPQWFDGNKYGGYYTQEQIKEVVAYADKKYINIIPEIEMPGHSLAALSAYPELACGDNPGPFKAAEKWGVFPEIYCAGKEHTFEFLEDVLTEVMALFPSKYIHIGGDEAPKTAWKTCSYCQKRIKNEKLRNENELQSYFIHRIEKFVNKNGRSIIGWDEILEGGLAPNATVMSWQTTAGGIAAAKQKHNVIMTPSNMGVYLDHVQGRSDQEPVTIGGEGKISKIYAYDPTPSGLTETEKKYILGVQANMWTEYMPTAAKVEYMLLPRIMAVSEIAWTTLERKDFKNFNENRVPLHLSLLDQTKTMYRVPEAIGAKDTSIIVNGEYFFDFKPSVKGAQIYYTIDGYMPDETTSLYTQPFGVKVPKGESRYVKSRVITPSGKRSVVTTTWLINRDTLPSYPSEIAKKSGSLKYYYVPGKFSNTSEIDTALATQKGLASQISFTKVAGKAREYGLVFTGFINVNESANFEFSLYSDDGSKLYIDDQLIIDNDGKHSRYERAAGVLLKSGLHKIKVAYFDDGPGSTLRVSVKGTDGIKIEIPSVMLSN